MARRKEKNDNDEEGLEEEFHPAMAHSQDPTSSQFLSSNTSYETMSPSVNQFIEKIQALMIQSLSPNPTFENGIWYQIFNTLAFQMTLYT